MNFPYINKIYSNQAIISFLIEALYSKIPNINVTVNGPAPFTGNYSYVYTIQINNFSNPTLGNNTEGFTTEFLYNRNPDILIDFQNAPIPLSENAFEINDNSKLFITNYNNLYTGHLTSMTSMFRNYSGIIDVSTILNNWDLSNVTVVAYTFMNNSLLNASFEDFDISNISNMAGFLDNTGLSTENYTKTLISWNNQPNKQSNVLVGVEGLTYDLSGAYARQILIDDYGWTFFGDNGPSIPEPEPTPPLPQNNCVCRPTPIPLLLNSHHNHKQVSSYTRVSQRLKYNRNLR